MEADEETVPQFQEVYIKEEVFDDAEAVSPAVDQSGSDIAVDLSMKHRGSENLPLRDELEKSIKEETSEPKETDAVRWSYSGTREDSSRQKLAGTIDTTSPAADVSHQGQPESSKGFLIERLVSCDTHIEKNASLSDNWRTHVHEERFICSTCTKEFSQKSELTAHQRLHTGQRPFVCPTCGKEFRHSANLCNHLRTHSGERPFICEICGKGFRESGTLNKHTMMHMDTRPFICSVCHRGFRQRSKLKEHLRVHSGEKPFQCNICSKSFSQSPKLTVHLRIHSGERPFACNMCVKAFCSKAGLKVHMRSHSSEKAFVCIRPKCGKKFRWKVSLVRHTAKHSSDDT